LVRNALRASCPGGSSGRKCVPAEIASVVKTRSQPGGGVRIAASSVNPSAPGWVASGLKNRAIRRSSAEPCSSLDMA
jgi:hypothetical protein